MKTAAEILEEYNEYFLCPNDYHEEVLIEKALEAMEKYADQFRQPDVSGNFANPKENKKESEVALPTDEEILVRIWERDTSCYGLSFKDWKRRQ